MIIAAHSVLPSDCGSAVGRRRTEASQTYARKKASVGAKKSKFWQSGGKIYLKNPGTRDAIVAELRD
jgi:hypothetical protein